MSSKNFRRSVAEKPLSHEEQQAKISEVRKTIGPIADKLPVLCSEASISRYLRARNWNTKKAGKMLKRTLKWRLEYKPEKIRWEDVAEEAKTGKIYRADYRNKHGRVVLVMRPGFQNTTSTEAHIRSLVYCMENAIINMNPDQEQMVWLIDFQQWTMSSVSVKTTKEIAHVLQDHYPERLGLAILYNPPKIFESFWTVVKPFLETKTYKKVKFVYSDNPQSIKLMEELFDLDNLERSFGGKNNSLFNYEIYAERMKEDDKKIATIASGCPPIYQHCIEAPSQHIESRALEIVSDDSDEEDRRSCSDEQGNLRLERVDKSTQGLVLGDAEVGSDEEVTRESKTSELI